MLRHVSASWDTSSAASALSAASRVAPAETSWRLRDRLPALAARRPRPVAISRHNNPDALLVLCCVAAVWCAVRALEGGRTRWLVLCGACVGLGFETKMGVALTVVPGIAAAWLWTSPAGRGRLHALRELLPARAVMA